MRHEGVIQGRREGLHSNRSNGSSDAVEHAFATRWTAPPVNRTASLMSSIIVCMFFFFWSCFCFFFLNRRVLMQITAFAACACLLLLCRPCLTLVPDAGLRTPWPSSENKFEIYFTL